MDGTTLPAWDSPSLPANVLWAFLMLAMFWCSVLLRLLVGFFLLFFLVFFLVFGNERHSPTSDARVALACVEGFPREARLEFSLFDVSPGWLLVGQECGGPARERPPTLMY